MKNELVKTSLDLYDQEKYGKVVEVVQAAFNQVVLEELSKEGLEIRGSIEFSAVEGEDFCHLETYGAKIEGEARHYYYGSAFAFLMNEGRLCGVRIFADLVDLEKVGDKNIAKAVSQRIARAINAQVAGTEDTEELFIASVETMVQNYIEPATIEKIYADSENIGIEDRELVKKAVDNLIAKRLLYESEDALYYSKPIIMNAS